MAGKAFRGVPGRPYTTIVRERPTAATPSPAGGSEAIAARTCTQSRTGSRSMEVVAQARGVEDADRAGGVGVRRARQHPLRGPGVEPRLEVLDDVAEAGGAIRWWRPASGDPATRWRSSRTRPRRRRRRARRAWPRLAERDDLGVLGSSPRDRLVGREARRRATRPPDRDDPALLTSPATASNIEAVRSRRTSARSRVDNTRFSRYPVRGDGVRPALGSRRTPSSTADRPRPVASRSFPPRTKPRAPRYSATTRGDPRRRALRAAAGGCRRAGRSSTGSCS